MKEKLISAFKKAKGIGQAAVEKSARGAAAKKVLGKVSDFHKTFAPEPATQGNVMKKVTNLNDFGIKAADRIISGAKMQAIYNNLKKKGKK